LGGAVGGRPVGRLGGAGALTSDAERRGSSNGDDDVLRGLFTSDAVRRGPLLQYIWFIV